MLNNTEFKNRLLYLMEYYQLSAAQFADKIGVQRSSISHLISGRNKPSLDFVLKIIEIFPELDLYWVLLGTGAFLKEEKKQIKAEINTETPNLFDSVAEKKEVKGVETENTLFTNVNNVNLKSSQRKLVQIVQFFDDGSFLDFYP